MYSSLITRDSCGHEAPRDTAPGCCNKAPGGGHPAWGGIIPLLARRHCSSDGLFRHNFCPTVYHFVGKIMRKWHRNKHYIVILRSILLTTRSRSSKYIISVLCFTDHNSLETVSFSTPQLVPSPYCNVVTIKMSGLMMMEEV